MDFSDDVLALNPDIFPGTPTGKKIKLRVEQVSGEPAFRSKYEQSVWRNWVPLQQPLLALYEPFVLHLKGGIRYTPDIALVTKSSELWLVEIKSNWDAYQSGRSSKHSLKQAAAEFSWLARFFSLTPAMERRPNKAGKMVWRSVGENFELHEFGDGNA